MDFIDPWMPQNSGGRLVESDILKGQQAMAEMSQVPSKIRLADAHSALYEAQAARAREQLQKDRDVREALQKMSTASAGSIDDLMDMISGEGDGGALGRSKNPLWQMSEVLRAVDPKLSGELANKASMIDAREIRGQKDVLRATQIAVQTQAQRWDLAGRRFGSVQTMDDLFDAARYFEAATGMKTGIFNKDGSNPTTNFTTTEAADKFAQTVAKQMGERTMQQKDRLLNAERQARDQMMQNEYDSRDRHRQWQEDEEAQRRRADATRKPPSEKAGEKSLTSTERKEGKDKITAEYSAIDKDRAATLGDELMDRAKRIKDQNKGISMTDAKEEALKQMRAAGRFIGIPGSGKSVDSPRDFPMKDGKPNVKGAEPNTWYRNGNDVFFYDGKRTYSPAEMRRRGVVQPTSFGGQQGSDEDEDEITAESGVDDDEED